jgi:hypothetical protein
MSRSTNSLARAFSSLLLNPNDWSCLLEEDVAGLLVIGANDEEVG